MCATESPERLASTTGASAIEAISTAHTPPNAAAVHNAGAWRSAPDRLCFLGNTGSTEKCRASAARTRIPAWVVPTIFKRRIARVGRGPLAEREADRREARPHRQRERGAPGGDSDCEDRGRDHEQRVADAFHDSQCNQHGEIGGETRKQARRGGEQEPAHRHALRAEAVGGGAEAPARERAGQHHAGEREAGGAERYVVRAHHPVEVRHELSQRGRGDEARDQDDQVAEEGAQRLRSFAARAMAASEIRARTPSKFGPRVASSPMRDVVPAPVADGSSALPGRPSRSARRDAAGSAPRAPTSPANRP